MNPLKKVLETLADYTLIGFIANITLVIILVAGFADLVENYFTYAILQTSLENTKHWMIDTVRWSATLKFGLIALTTLIFSIIFWRVKNWKILSVALVLISILGFAGLIWHQLIGAFMLLQIITLVIVCVAFISAPHKFSRA